MRSAVLCILPGLMILLLPLSAIADPVEDARVIVLELAGPDTRGRAADTDLGDAMRWLEEGLGELGPVRRQSVEGTGVESANLMLLRDPAKDDAGWVVLGAHYDHLGVGEVGEAHAGKVFHGADDNASGCAVLLLAARMLFQEYGDSDRGLAIVFFTGEEQGLIGSRAFLESGPVSADQIVAMINVDTVGRLDGGELTLFGVASARVFSSALDGLNSVFDLPMQKVDLSSGASDDMPFIESGIPSLHLFTGAWPEYHRPSDTMDTIDFEGLALLAEFTAELVNYLASAETQLDFVTPQNARALADPSRTTEGRRRVSFGSIPDFKFEGEGVLLSGVLPGSPAAAAGLQTGDLITGFAGTPITDLTDYSEAMKQHAPGDVVVVEYVRDGEAGSVEVTLTERR
jgi:hypothetical protein